ncbi:MAG: lipopolysaccharide biosynthesis protein [Eubacteriales bacterium]|jgi:O-antigen/teichoic acid export membrane protein
MDRSDARMGRAALLFLPAKVLEGLIGVWTLSFTVSALSYNAYERFSAVNTVVVFANLLLLGWIINASTRYVGDYACTDDAPRFFSTTAALWSIPNLLVLTVTAILHAVTGNSAYLAGFCMLAATSLYQIVLGMLVQTGRKTGCVAISLASALLKPAVMWGCCMLLTRTGKVDRILPAVLGYAVSELLGGLAGAILLKIPRSLSWKGFSRRIAKLFAGYGIPLMGVSVSVGLLNMVDRFIILLFAGDFGAYNANNTIANTVFTMLNVGVMRAVYPAVLKGYREGGVKSAKPLLDRGARMYVLLALPAAAGLCGIARTLSAFLYQGDAFYVSASPVIGIAALAMFFSGLNEYAIKTWELRGRTVPIMVNAFIAVAVKIAVSCALLTGMGFLGAAIGSLTGFILYFTLSFLRARRTLVFTLRPRTLICAPVGSILCGGGAYLVCTLISRPVLALVCAIPVGVVLYAATLLISGEIRGEIDAVVRRLRGRR